MGKITPSFKEWIKQINFDEKEDIFHLYETAVNHYGAGQFVFEEKDDEWIITSTLSPEMHLSLRGNGKTYFPIWLNGYFAAITKGENIEDWGNFNEAISKED
ncbi:MAG: hypothetical protein IJT51_07935 [Bacteroidales bacterium]|nr:hypothetical protein [Bacteroidales bacterium]